MSDDDIKPVAWTSECQLSAVRIQGDGIMAADDRHWSIALYDQSAIDRLTAERDAAVADAKRLRSVIEYALSQHNYGCLPLQNHWAAKAMSDLAAIDAASIKNKEQANG